MVSGAQTWRAEAARVRRLGRFREGRRAPSSTGGGCVRWKDAVRACVGEREAARGPSGAGGGGERPWTDRRRRGVRGDQGRQRPTVRADPAPGAPPDERRGFGVARP